MLRMLPETGLWRVAGRVRLDAAPFDAIKLDLRGLGSGAAKGTVRSRNLETRLGRIRVTGPDRFAAVYDIRGHRGAVQGTLRPDGSLRLELSGTTTGTFVARRTEADAAEPAGAAFAVRAFAGAVEPLRRPAAMTQPAAA